MCRPLTAIAWEAVTWAETAPIVVAAEVSAAAAAAGTSAAAAAATAAPVMQGCQSKMCSMGGSFHKELNTSFSANGFVSRPISVGKGRPPRV